MVRLVVEVIDGFGLRMAMFPHEAECMIRRRGGIGDVVVRHVSRVLREAWPDLQDAVDGRAYLNMRRPSPHAERLLPPAERPGQQSLHGPRPTLQLQQSPSSSH